MLNVLVVDDYPLEGKTIEFLLKKNRPQVRYLGQALSGDEGLKIVGEQRTDLVFLDIKMPGMSGIEFAAHLKEASPDTQVVFVTAFDDFEFMQSAVRLGASDYLLKPICADDLYRIIDAVERKLAATETAPAQGKNIPEELQKLLDALVSGEQSAAERAFADFWAFAVRESGGEIAAVRAQVKTMAGALRAQETGLDSEQKSEVLELLAKSFSKEIGQTDTVAVLEKQTREFLLNCARVFDDGLCSSGSLQIEQAKALIEEMLGQEITLEAVAQKVFLSPFYLSRSFKKYTGINFLDYVSQRRIERAKTLLLTTNQTIETISVEVGYEEVNSFRRLFRRRTGMSPSEYRRAGKMPDGT